MEYRMGSCIGVAHNQVTPPSLSTEQQATDDEVEKEMQRVVQEVDEILRDACDRDRAGWGFLGGGCLCWSIVTSGKEGRRGIV